MPSSGYLLRDPLPKQNVRGAADTAQEGRHGHQVSAFRLPLALEDAHKLLEVKKKKKKKTYSLWDVNYESTWQCSSKYDPSLPVTRSASVCAARPPDSSDTSALWDRTHTHKYTHGPGLITHSRLVREIWNYDGTMPSLAWLLL